MKLIQLILVVMILNISIVRGQCPPSTTCTTTWTTVEHDMDELLDEPGFRASATFSYRVNCDGDFEFIIDNIEIIDNLNYLDDFSIYHYNYSSITEKVALDYLLSSDSFAMMLTFLM